MPAYSTSHTVCRFCNSPFATRHTLAGAQIAACDGCARVFAEGVNASNQAEYFLDSGVRIAAVQGGWLVPSGPHSQIVHQVSATMQCSCAAALAGRACWHVEAITLLKSEQVATLTDELLVDFPNASWNERYAIASAIYPELSAYELQWDTGAAELCGSDIARGA